MSKKSVQDWVLVIQTATDKNSPFRGQVDLTPIFKEPLETQHEIFNLLSDETKVSLKELYGG